MRKIHYFICIIFLLIVTKSCNEKDEPIQKRDVNENTKIPGNYFIKGKSGNSFLELDQTDFSSSYRNGFLTFSMYKHSETVIFNIWNIPDPEALIVPKTFYNIINDAPGVGVSYMNPTIGSSYYNMPVPGSFNLTITRINKSVIEGSFSGKLQNNVHSTIEVRDGSFICKYDKN